MIHYGIPLDSEIILPSHGIAEAASREAAERELAYIKALNAPQWKAPPQPEVRSPTLPDNLQEQLARVDEAITKRGLVIDRDKFVALGKERFARLLEADHEARAERIVGTRIDLTSWPSVLFALGMAGALQSATPRRKTWQEYAGVGQDREQAAQIQSFDDIWKLTTEPRAVPAIYKFRDLLEDLLFGRSLLEHLGKDSRVRSPFFTGGSGRRVECLRSWLSVLRPPIVSIEVKNPLWSVLAWLSGETQPPVDPASLAQELSGLRAPGQRDVTLAEALLDGVLLNLGDWELWDFVGRRTRTALDHSLLMTWRKELARRWPKIMAFHADLAACFYKPEGDHLRLDSKRHRLFINQVVSDALASVSALITCAVAEDRPVARFHNWTLTERLPKDSDKINAALLKAFPGVRFQLDVK